VKRNRPDLGSFNPGSLYRHSATGELVEFVGIAFAARREDTEDVAVFRFVAQPGAPLAASRAGYDAGETFEPVHPSEATVLEVAPDPRPSPPVGRVDREDIFGVRRALATLPEHRWDAFLHRWAQLGDRCEYDLRLIRAAALQEAEEQRKADSELAGAWATVAGAMSGYLTWRARPA
jgi:hypothetical protein